MRINQKHNNLKGLGHFKLLILTKRRPRRARGRQFSLATSWSILWSMILHPLNILHVHWEKHGSHTYGLSGQTSLAICPRFTGVTLSRKKTLESRTFNFKQHILTKDDLWSNFRSAQDKKRPVRVSNTFSNISCTAVTLEVSKKMLNISRFIIP